MAGFLFKSPSYQLVDANGDVYPGAKINFYLTGTSTRSDSYQDSGLATPHTNPVVADSAGLFAPIYLDPDITYKVVVTDTDDVVLQTIDPVVIDIGTGNNPFKDLTPAADKVPYYTSSTAAALADFGSYGRSLVAVANEAAFKTLVNLEIGTDVQAYHAYLADIAGLSPSNGDLLEFDGTDFVTKSSTNLNYAQAECFSASGTWTAPYACNVKIWAFGAGGGAANRTGTGGCGGGGAGGATMLEATVASGLVLTVTVGAAGAGGGTNAVGSAGGNTTVTGTGISLTANGGGGGNTSGVGGTGGTASGGDINYAGGDGGGTTGSHYGSGGAVGLIRAGVTGQDGSTGGGVQGAGLHETSYSIAGFIGCNIPPLSVDGVVGGAGVTSGTGGAGGNFCGGGSGFGTGGGTGGAGGIAAGGGGYGGTSSGGGGGAGGGGLVIIQWTGN